MSEAEEIEVECATCNIEKAKHERRWLGLQNGWVPREPYIALQLRKNTEADCRRQHIFPRTLPLQTGSYEAWAAIIHYGHSIKRGHYTALARDDDRRWWSMDDSQVVTREWGDDINPYMVVYKHVDSSIPQHPPAHVDIEVMSWNVSGLHFSALMLEGVVHTIRTKAPTVIMLQEVNRKQQDVLRERFDSIYVFTVGDTNATHTCMIGVRCPATLTDACFLTFLNTSDSRGFFSATLECSGKSLRLVTTHLESGAEASAARCEQLAQVLSEDAHVVAGDLNIRDTELQGQNLQEWHDVWRSSGQNADHRFTWDTHHNSRLQAQQKYFFSKPRFRFDRIYVRNSAAIQISQFRLLTEKIQGTHVSDHFALVAKLRLC